MEYYFEEDGTMVSEKTPRKPGHKLHSLDVIMAGLRDGTGFTVQHHELEKMGRSGNALTITYTDNNLTMYNTRYLYAETCRQITKTRGLVGYILIPELSECGRFHLHGVIHMKDCVGYKRVSDKLRRSWGIIKLKPISNTEGWADYCLKQYKKTQTEIDSEHIIIDKTP